MEQPTVPIAEQVREVVQAAMEALRVPRPEEISPSAAANSFEAEALRAEIISVGRKLWERQYVDGNGGNISVRLGAQYVLCTPTMMSKRDMEPADICLSDLEGKILAGDRPRTSELLLHLEIYKANPRARAVVHCHPPYATAFAITGSAPPMGLSRNTSSILGRRRSRAMRLPAHRPLPKRCCPLCRITTPFCFPIMASSAGPTQ